MSITIVRHGESEWNKKNLFTGFMDIDLSDTGIKEAEDCGNELNEKYDIAFTSDLQRAYKTCNIICSMLNSDIEVIRSKDLKERDYGDLTGKNKKETAKIYGEEQVQLWRRSVDVRPPNGENLHDVIDRVKLYFDKEIKAH